MMSIHQWFVAVAFLFLVGMTGMILALATDRKEWRRLGVAAALVGIVGLLGVAASTSAAAMNS